MTPFAADVTMATALPQDGDDLFDFSRTDIRFSEDLSGVFSEIEGTLFKDPTGHNWTYRELLDTLVEIQAQAGQGWQAPVNVVVPLAKKDKVLMAVGTFHSCIPFVEMVSPGAGDQVLYRIKSPGITPQA